MMHTKKSVFFAIALIGCAVAPVGAGTFPTFCWVNPWLRDNLTVKADVPEGGLRIEKEGSFRVYICNTMDKFSFFDAKLGIFSEQFDVDVAPSPAWKTYPDVPPAAGIGKGSPGKGSMEYFTVTLKRKSGVPDGAYDLLIKLYATSHGTNDHAMAAFLTLPEALDEQPVPLRSTAIALHGKPAATDWADSLSVQDFLAYKPSAQGVLSFLPASPTRLRLTADDANLYLLAHFMGAGKNGEIRLYFASGIEAAPKVVTLDQASGKLAADFPLDGAQCVPCAGAADGGAMFELRLPRQPLGLQGKKAFLLNFARVDRTAANDLKPEVSYWRGNARSVEEPVVYARAKLDASIVRAPAVVAGGSGDDFGEASRPHLIPTVVAGPIDGSILPVMWARSYVISGFRHYEKTNGVWQGGSPDLSRLQLAADKDNLYVLATLISRSAVGVLKLFVTPDAKTAPVWIAFDRRTDRFTASAPSVIAGAACKVNKDDDFLGKTSRAKNFNAITYVCSIPRKSLGIEGKADFLANASYEDYPAYWMPHAMEAPTPMWNAYWRGTPDTAADLASFARFAFAK